MTAVNSSTPLPDPPAHFDQESMIARYKAYENATGPLPRFITQGSGGKNFPNLRLISIMLKIDGGSIVQHSPSFIHDLGTAEVQPTPGEFNRQLYTGSPDSPMTDDLKKTFRAVRNKAEKSSVYVSSYLSQTGKEVAWYFWRRGIRCFPTHMPNFTVEREEDGKPIKITGYTQSFSGKYIVGTGKVGVPIVID